MFKNFSKNHKLIIILFCSSTLICVLNQTMLSPAIPSLSKDLNSSYDDVQLLISLYLLFSAILMPLNATIIDRFSPKKICIFSLLIFMFGCICLVLSSELRQAILGRIFQAIGAGIITPSSMSYLMIIYPKEKRGGALGFYGIITGIGPAIGPFIGGIVIDFFGWRFVFLFLSILCLCLMLLSLLLLNNDILVPSNKSSIDIVSIITLIAGMLFVVFGFSGSVSNEYMFLQIIFLVSGFCLISFFTYRQFYIETPVLKFNVLKNRAFRVSVYVVVIMYSSGMCNSILIPVFVQDICLQNASMSGLILVPGSVLSVFMSPIVGRYFDKYGVKWIAYAGTFMMVIANFAFCFMNSSSSMFLVSFIITIKSVGLLIVLRVLPTWGINSLKREDISHGNAILNTLRQICGSIFTAISIWIYETVVYLTPVDVLFTFIESDVLFGVIVLFFLQGAVSLIMMIYLIGNFKRHNY